MAYIFQNMAKRGQIPAFLAKTQQNVRDWWRTRSQEMIHTRPERLTKQKGFINQSISKVDEHAIGRLILFNYDPKHKKTLPYYDRYPMVFPIEIYNDGFLGINLHYLPFMMRARLMDALYETMITNENNEKERLAISYQILSSSSKFKYFRPCIKRYLVGHVRSTLYNVNVDDWDKALMLPLARFEKKTQTQVWAESMKKIK